jgi:aspartyl-tRNA(Asn)/glutamyl-tRNA(Gln) amidotransferase subunit A
MNGSRDTILATVAAIRGGKQSISGTIEAYLGRISQKDKEIGAFLHVMGEAARERARSLEILVEAGDWPGPLTGIAIAVKDNISVPGAPLTAGSRILEGFKPIYRATVISRLEAAGAICIGKTNLDEFAMGSSTEFSAFQPTCNPYDHSRVPGGSSGGSAAAVAANFAPAALGSDTGGSVRQPAAFCGLVGFKPCYGAVSRYGLVAFASSMDQIGPIAATAGDCAEIYRVIAGADQRDSTCPGHQLPFELTDTPRQLRIGIPTQLIKEEVEPELVGQFEQVCERFRQWGHELIPVDIPDPERDLATYHILADGEASSNLARYDGIHYGPRCDPHGALADVYRSTRGRLFGNEVKRRILMGTFVLSSGYYDAYYQKALLCRESIRRAYGRLYADVDLLFTPTTPTAAFRRGEKDGDPLAMYQCDRFTIAANLTGDPAISFPIGETSDRLPVGGQLSGPAGCEPLLFGLAARVGEGQ